MKGRDADRMNKDELRRKMAARRRDLDHSWIKENSRAAQEALKSLPEFGMARIVCCYIAMRGEVRTDLIIEQCWISGRTLCVPAFNRASGSYNPVRMRRDTPMGMGPARAPEPLLGEEVDLSGIGLMIVPGLAFDGLGGRLGRGGGHYDSIMAGTGGLNVFKTGLAFEFQVVDHVPVGEKDVRLDAVITEKRIIRTQGA